MPVGVCSLCLEISSGEKVSDMPEPSIKPGDTQLKRIELLAFLANDLVRPVRADFEDAYASSKPPADPAMDPVKSTLAPVFKCGVKI